MRKQRSAWNKGHLLGQKPPLTPKEIWSLRIRLQLADNALQRPVQFEITEATRELVAAWVARSDLRSTSYLFPGRGDERHLSVRQYSRIVKGWVGRVGLDQSRYGTHSLRRTKATLIYKRTKNIRAIQLLLSHTKLESTVRYPGIEVDDALEISEQTEI